MFDVGDRVRIKSRFPSEGAVDFASGMLKYLGQEVEIVHCKKPYYTDILFAEDGSVLNKLSKKKEVNSYHISGDAGDYIWYEDMLEPICDDISELSQVTVDELDDFIRGEY